MRLRFLGMLLGFVLCVAPGLAKDKKQAALPTYILQARTVAVLIDPDAGVDVRDPQANKIAQKDVEEALLRWGRFEPVMNPETADLILVVRRGSGNAVNGTISDPRQNHRPGMIDATDSGILIGGQRGRSSGTQPQPDGSAPNGPRPRVEAGAVDDSLLVYQGQVAGDDRDALAAPPGWRYVAKDALRSHSVPAVDAFRKAIAEAEKAASKP